MGSLKRPRVKIEVEIETVSKYFKQEQKDGLVKRENEHGLGIQDVDIDSIKRMGAQEYFKYINRFTKDDISGEKLKIEDNPNIPANFIPIYSKVRLMRSLIKTPVDSVGCAMLPITINSTFGIEQEKMKPKNYRLQLLISLMLSSQTKDETNAKAMHNLMEYCIEELGDPEGITLDALLKCDEKNLDNEIHSVGFHTRRASYIKKAAVMLRDQFDGDVPTTIEGFISLPGVGPKMGYLALQKSWAKIDGIGVDVHVDRLAKMWGWVDSKLCKTPEHTRKQLETWLPKSLWYEINPVLVGFGQVLCMPRGKKCNLCLVKDICPGVDKKLLKRIKETQLDDDPVKDSIRGDYSELVSFLKEQKKQSKEE
ncbi:DNA N-glycosylase and apurinic/apyrimidinic (AP) lyase [Kluyveromyces marxianus]|nr:DNA N-glycosylase and apurinic/apyrimidinic (AP) lyase [Kluyveromyces marxianus]